MGFLGHVTAGQCFLFVWSCNYRCVNKSILLTANLYSETICTRFVVPLYFGGDVCGFKRIDSGN